MKTVDTLILGAGAAGLFCAGSFNQPGDQHQSLLVLDHAKKPAEKVHISGGGRCNFTNLHSNLENFISSEAQFARTTLKAYGPQDFIQLVQQAGISFHEKTLGQLFCDTSSKDIIKLLLNRCRSAGADIWLETKIEAIAKQDGLYLVQTSRGNVKAHNLIVATGGKSIPKLGATSFGYALAEQFGLKVRPTRAGLVPFVLREQDKVFAAGLSGLSVQASVQAQGPVFQEGFLFTHRGISGPSTLQASSYWQEGQAIHINLLPGEDIGENMRQLQTQGGTQEPLAYLSGFLPRRLAQQLCEQAKVGKRLAEISKKSRQAFAETIHHWRLYPQSTEGYRTAEVTLGGVDCRDLNPKTLECRKQSGLYFIGEVVDVTGHLGGHNFQWAWASAWAVAKACKASFHEASLKSLA